MKHILFNIASRTRPDKFNAIVQFITDNCEQPYTVLAKIDDDDPCRNRYNTSHCLVVGGSSDSKIHAINKGIPTYGWDIIVDLSDDFVLTDTRFDRVLRDNCGPEDFLLLAEPFADRQAAIGKNERIPIMLCMGNEYYQKDEYLFNPEYKSLFADNEAGAVARIRGRLKEVNESIFYHAHPCAGYGKADAQTQHTESFWKEDKATYYRRKEAGFP